MSSDRQVLSALALKTSKDMRYFEVVYMSCGPDKKKCFVCLSKHSLIFLRQDMSEMNKDGELPYGHIMKVIEDCESQEHLLLMLHEHATWASDKISIKSEKRDVLMQHFQVSWQADHMWRSGKVAKFPRATYPLTQKSKSDPEVEAFLGHQWVSYHGYKFMLPTSFVEQANSIQADSTGEYIDKQTGITVAINVHESMTMEQLNLIHREHIRWVAADYKAQLVRDESHFYVLRSAQRFKRMNLVGDVAAWYGWELIIRTRTSTIVCLLLRRQYIPPLCDCAQDLAIVMKCPVEYWMRFEVQTLLQAHLISDSFSPCASPSIYRELVQAKLDGLRFDEDGIDWIGNHHKLSTKLRKEAKRFLRTILALFITDGNEHFKPDLLTNRRYLAQPQGDEDWEDLPEIPGGDFRLFFQDIKARGEGLASLPGDADAKEAARNRWLARVARYFAWAVDGGLLGARFTLDLMIDSIPEVTQEDSVEKLTTALMFLLHMRELDMTAEWEERKLVDQLNKGGADRWMFNDRVMQQLISNDYLRKQFGRTKDGVYFKHLANLLRSKAGVSLKAYICRIFMEMRAGGTGSSARTDDDANVVAVPALLHLLEQDSIYLATFASAALVNLSHANEAVKMQLMCHGMAKVSVKNIKSKDDDLICYTLTLLVNLTKEAHHRYIMANAGVLPLLYDMMTSSYHQCKSAGGAGDSLSSPMLINTMKEKILAHICSIMGHFCKDEEYRDQLIDHFPHTVKCLVYICTHSTPGSQLMSKVMYALKQVCAARNDQKRYVGANVLKPIIEVFKDAEVMNKGSSEFLSHALLLLQLLASFRDNCIRLDDANAVEVLRGLEQLPSGKKIDNWVHSLQSLQEIIKDVVRRQFMA